MNNFQTGARLAFDVGSVRVGVAACDRDGILTFPVTTLNRKNITELEDSIKNLLDEYDPFEIFVGLPKNLKNQNTASTADAIHFAKVVQQLFTGNIWLVDERLSTVSASQALQSAGKNAKSQKPLIDQQAACVILETGLDFERNQRNAGLLIDEF